MALETVSSDEQTAALVAGALLVLGIGHVLATHSPVSCPVCGSPVPCPSCPGPDQLCNNYESN